MNPSLFAPKSSRCSVCGRSRQDADVAAAQAAVDAREAERQRVLNIIKRVEVSLPRGEREAVRRIFVQVLDRSDGRVVQGAA